MFRTELKLSDDHEGILILPEDAPLGQAFGEHLGRAERIRFTIWK